MSKNIIFSKIGIIDYNNKLENVLEKKNFSEVVKNLLLSMLYKIENAYQDYKQVKRNVMKKNKFVEEIINTIEYDCEEIILIKPYSEESKILGEYNFKVEGKKIYAYQNEKSILDAILVLAQDEVQFSSKYDLMAKSLTDFLNISFRTNNSEVIRDFNGWSWDILEREIENKNYNIAYQNMIILLGNKFMEDWINKNSNPDEFEVEPEEEYYEPINTILSNKNFTNIYDENNNIDYIERMQLILKELYGEKLANEFENNLVKFLIYEYTKKDEKEKKRILAIIKEYEKELSIMNDKKAYLELKASQKKENIKNIKEIDELLNNNKLLKREYIKTNESLPNKEKIFSISHFEDRLQKQRKKYLKQMEEINKSIEPTEYVKTKEELETKLEFLKSIGIEKNKNNNTSKNTDDTNSNIKDENKEKTATNEEFLMQNLQESFVKCFEQKIKNAEDKKELLEYIYELRYYMFLQPEKYKAVKEKLEKKLIKLACEQKVIATVSEDEKLNYEILKNIFTSKIITLEEIYMKFSYNQKEATLQVEIYDEKEHELTIQVKIKEKTQLNVKLNKKVKIFI